MNSYERIYNKLVEAKGGGKKWEIDRDDETEDEEAERMEREGAEDARSEFNPETKKSAVRRSVGKGKKRATDAINVIRSLGWNVPWEHRSQEQKDASSARRGVSKKAIPKDPKEDK